MGCTDHHLCTPMHTPYIAGDGGPGAPKLNPRAAKPLPAWEGQCLLASLCGSAISLGCHPFPHPMSLPVSGIWLLLPPVTPRTAASLPGQARASCLSAGIWPHPPQSFPGPVIRVIFQTQTGSCLSGFRAFPGDRPPLLGQDRGGWLARLPPLVGWLSPQGGPLSGQAPAPLQPLPLWLPGVSSCSEFLPILQGSNFTS